MSRRCACSTPTDQPRGGLWEVRNLRQHRLPYHGEMALRDPQPETEGTVAANGDVIVASAAVAPLKLKPGQHVRVQVFPSKPRRNMRGLLAGQLPELTDEDFRTVRDDMWRGFPGTRAS
jgi:hypothetical protein